MTYSEFCRKVPMLEIAIGCDKQAGVFVCNTAISIPANLDSVARGLLDMRTLEIARSLDMDTVGLPVDQQIYCLN